MTSLWPRIRPDAVIASVAPQLHSRHNGEAESQSHDNAGNGSIEDIELKQHNNNDEPILGVAIAFQDSATIGDDEDHHTES